MKRILRFTNTSSDIRKIQRLSTITALLVLCSLIMSLPVFADQLIFQDPSGLSAEATFTLIGANTLQIVLKNTSTDYPDYFDDGNLNSNILVTSIAFDLGGIDISSGTVVVGDSSSTVNFDGDLGDLTAGEDVSTEWGFGNEGNTGFGSLVNFVSAMNAHTTPFALPPYNLDGPDGLAGPQGGLISEPLYTDVGTGGLGAILDSVAITLALTDPLADLSFLNNGVIVEFGSDAAFVPVPEPATMLLLVSGLIGLGAFRRRFRKK